MRVRETEIESRITVQRGLHIVCLLLTDNLSNLLATQTCHVKKAYWKRNLKLTVEREMIISNRRIRDKVS